MGRFVYGFLLLAAAVTVAWYGWIEKRFSLPGLVHEVHAGIQADCFACHNEDHGIDAARCASCHRDANTGEPASFSGMASHHTDATLVCQECHIEHKGPKGNLTKKDKSLETAGCAVCHERHVGRDFQYALRAAAHPNDTIHKGHSDLASGCMACHDENSRVSNHKCFECHAEATDQTPERSGFALHHRGKGLDCLKCHTEHRRTTTLKATAPETIKANCAECHAQHVAEGRDFKLRASDHPGRTLHAAHTRWQADCMACHTQGAGVEPAKCTVCHDPKTGEKIAFNDFSAHHADGALNCLECHLEHRGPQGRL
ncbi:hypothetical protein HQ560_20875, partial [bacterium]|nr:hypothetical protein [bacterium]